MSFICQSCEKIQKKPTLLTIESRKVTYLARYNEDNKLIDKGGSGFETVREIQICGNCVKEL